MMSDQISGHPKAQASTHLELRVTVAQDMMAGLVCRVRSPVFILRAMESQRSNDGEALG